MSLLTNATVLLVASDPLTLTFQATTLPGQPTFTMGRTEIPMLAAQEYDILTQLKIAVAQEISAQNADPNDDDAIRLALQAGNQQP